MRRWQAAFRGGADCLAFATRTAAPFRTLCRSHAAGQGRFPAQSASTRMTTRAWRPPTACLRSPAGATHVQGTLVGFGERCGNANLSTVLATFTQAGLRCVPSAKRWNGLPDRHEVADISNISVGKNMPYVGANAFAHKGGMHVDGVMKNSLTFEHVPPPRSATAAG